MSRIRSVHPGLWTDEAFMRLSAHARLLYIGLWTEAWDDGVFEWKPLTLKARIFPADNVDVAALLAELVDADCIKEGDGSGKMYGLIRNFRHYQRPKKPNSSGLLSELDREYVGLVPNQGGTEEEKSPQMEDGGWRVEEGDTNSPPVLVAEEVGARDTFDEIWSVFPRNPTSMRADARRQYDRLAPKAQLALLDAAKRYRLWFTEECVARKRTEDAGERFVPHLDNWIESGAWQQAGALPIKSESKQPVIPVTKLDRERDRDLWLACEKVMGKKAPTSNNEWWFKDAVIAEARQQVGESVH